MIKLLSFTICMQLEIEENERHGRAQHTDKYNIFPTN